MRDLVKRKWGGILFLLLVLITAAWAVQINLRIEAPDGTIKNEKGEILNSGTIKVIKSGESILSGSIAKGGYFYQTSAFEANNNDILYLRASWGSGGKDYYRKSSTYTISWQEGAPPSPLYNWQATSFSNYYIEEAPPKASIGSISLSYTGELKPLATIPINVDTTHHEVSARHIKIWEYPSGTVKADVDCGTSYTSAAGVLQLNTVYSVEAYAKNQFGTGTVSDVKGFEIKGPTTGKIQNLQIKLNAGSPSSLTLSWQPQEAEESLVYQSTDDGKTWENITAKLQISGDKTKSTTIASPPARVFYRVKASGGSFADEIVGSLTFKLRKISNKTGLNCIAIPFDTNGDAVLSPKMAMTAQGLAESIGAAFESLGRWDETGQTTYGFTKTPAGFVGINFNLEKNAGYQVSVSKDTDWTVVGQVSGKI